MAQRMNVESFNLDHRAVVAPYIRLADRRRLPHGDVISKYDVRFTQPNQEHLDSATIHSLEHLFAEHAREHCEDVLDFSPMGCQTGYYLTLAGAPTDGEVFELVAATLGDVLAAEQVPAANEEQCGWGAHHCLTGAQAAAQRFLDRREDWGQVYA